MTRKRRDPGLRRGVVRTTKLAIGAMLAVVMVTQDGGASQEITTEQVIALLRDLQKVGLPETIPRRLRSGLTDAEIGDYDPTDISLGFMDPRLLEEQDRELARKIKRFWRAPGRDRLNIVRDLALLIKDESDPVLNDLITDVVVLVLEDSFDVEGRAKIMRDVAFAVLDSNAAEETRTEFLWNLFLIGYRPDAEAGGRLVDLATGRDHERGRVRQMEIEALRRLRPEDASQRVRAYLLEAAAADTDLACRVTACRALPKLFDEGIWFPVVLETLEAGIDEDPFTAAAVVQDLAASKRGREAAPLLMRALSSGDPSLIGEAVNGLENIFGVEDRELGYDSLYVHIMSIRPSSDPDAAEINSQIQKERQAAVAGWRKWWSENCDGQFSECP